MSYSVFLLFSFSLASKANFKKLGKPSIIVGRRGFKTNNKKKTRFFFLKNFSKFFFYFCF